ncbi:GNAT family N-acetyltransferase [Candidatus Roizmanbacteria bacterium]|nr:GNAT family N-acetyltransferase [Candidatus Roizmanbacteria bacterium]
MELILPSLQYKKEYLQALEEVIGETGETQLNKPDPGQTFEAFVQMWKDHSQGKNLHDGRVAATMYWLLDNGEIIGRAHIRHTLNDFLLKHGGHIGYYIKPSKRRMGYGRKILQLALEKAKDLGITKALVTCDDDNVGSQKVIESCGGILENKVQNEEGKPLTRRYWITRSTKLSNNYD